MIEINDINGFPKLIPDESIRFDAKDGLRRSAETNFECSELEYRIRLTPDTNIRMPGKQSLKHRTFKPRLIWLSIAVAAAVLAFVLILTNDGKPDSPSIAGNGLPAPVPETVQEINPETKTESEPEPETESRVSKIRKTRPDITLQKIAETASETDKMDGQDLIAETSESKNDTPVPENVRIERIPSLAVPLETMKKKETVFIFMQDYPETMVFKAVNGMTSTARKLSADISTNRQNITQIIDGFRIPNILGRLSPDSSIDREIDKWTKEHPDIPFNVLVDHYDENKIMEVYDENGTLVRAVFFTGRTLKYKDNKIYQVSNNLKQF
ncbi:MAG: hypothetical protein LBK58_01100 [Prevotellaceae bacterium]|nr:hypothetical protein [Prevotellaceae bacterium]